MGPGCICWKNSTLANHLLPSLGRMRQGQSKQALGWDHWTGRTVSGCACCLGQCKPGSNFDQVLLLDLPGLDNTVRQHIPSMPEFVLPPLS